jgi:[ribosomal protein S5]-alanine N-acetyltransferase
MDLFTPRLRLREFVETDWEAVLHYQSDPRYLQYNHWTSRTPAEVRAFIDRFIQQQGESPRVKFQFAITRLAPGPDSGALIGNCGIRKSSADATEGNIGYELAPWHWGYGYATEAAHAVVAFGFGTLGLHRIWAECIADNTASAHVLEKLGMQQEGRLRENRHMKGRWWDTLLYAILDREWQARQENG